VTVFIHIGASKKGTKSIQKTMGRNAGLLRRRYSINFPGFDTNHWALALPFLRQEKYAVLDRLLRGGVGSRDHFLAVADRFLKRFGHDAERYQTHAISSEHFAQLNRESASELRSYFVDLGLQTKIVVYVRHPAERLSSHMNQELKDGNIRLGDRRTKDTLTPVLRAYSEAFGKENMIVRRFGAPYFVNGDLIDDFTSVIHGTPIQGLDVFQLNESISLPAVLLADQLNEIAPRFSPARGTANYLERIAGPKFLAPRPLVEAAIKAHHEFFEYLDREFGIRFDDVDLSVFPEALSYEFSTETIASVAAILNEQSLTIDRFKGQAKRRRLKHRIKKLLGLAPNV
jgi:hypothetical protein